MARGWGTEFRRGSGFGSRVIEIGFVTGFATIAFGHPNGFRRFSFWSSAWEFNEIPFGSVYRSEGLADDRAGDLAAVRDEFSPQGI